MWLLGELWAMEERVAGMKRWEEGAVVEAKDKQMSWEEETRGAAG